MERIGIRELRNNTARAVRRAMGGERIVITIDGVPAAQLGPLNAGAASASVDDLVAAGLLRAPRASTAPPPPRPVAPPPGVTTTEILREHRSR
jgi:prevent-host-death family protein